MAEFQTSFIPKKSFDVGTGVQKHHTSFFFIIAVLIFIIALVSAGGAFLYDRFLGISLAHKKEDLEKVKSAFEPELIRKLSRLDSKLHTSQTLLNSHIALSSFFELLENMTLESIRFKTFSYIAGDTDIRISMQGEALSYAAIALQSDEFAKQRFIREPVFSGLDLDDKGNVIFTVTAFVDPALLSYRDRALHAGTAAFNPESSDTFASGETDFPEEQTN